MRFRSVIAFVALAVLAGCGEGAPPAPPTQPVPSPMAMPALNDVISSNTTDRGCACQRDAGACAMLADAVPGRFEGRNLQCTIVSREEGTVRCRFEERFVIESAGQPPEAGPWQPRDSQFRRLPGGWCVG